MVSCKTSATQDLESQYSASLQPWAKNNDTAGIRSARVVKADRVACYMC